MRDRISIGSLLLKAQDMLPLVKNQTAIPVVESTKPQIHEKHYNQDPGQLSKGCPTGMSPSRCARDTLVASLQHSALALARQTLDTGLAPHTPALAAVA